MHIDGRNAYGCFYHFYLHLLFTHLCYLGKTSVEDEVFDGQMRYSCV